LEGTPVNFVDLCLLLASISASVGGQFFLKSGAMKLGAVNGTNVVGVILGMVTNWQILAGLTCYALGVITYILLLNRVALSIASPALALSYVFAVLIGVFFFKEPMSLVRAMGVGMIFGGVILLTQKH
jgi:drug/metabolite transporter (DMT)-like permease